MNPLFFLLGVYIVFMLWHNRWFAKPLRREEVEAWQAHQASGTHGTVSAQERENIRAFLEGDDGKPFYMVNLMKYREKALYPNGEFPEVKTGKQANALYSRAVVWELLKRGSYPVFLSRKLGNLLGPEGRMDFFEEVGIVRYRSRRDMMRMTASPGFLQAEVHKWASMEKTVVVPTRKVLLLDLNLVVGLVLLVIGLATSI